MQIQCVHCGKQYSLRDENVGSQFACRSCGKLSPIAAAKPEESTVVATLPPPAKPIPPQAGHQRAPAADSAEPIDVECRHCGKQYKLRTAAVGMQFKCKECGGLTPLAARSASPERAPTAPPRDAPLKAIPLNAAPPPAAPARAAPLAAKPVAPLAAKPAARLARPAQARPAAMSPEPLTAELVAEPAEASPLVSPGMLDLLNEAALPGAASPYGLAAAETRPMPQTPTPPKPKRKRKSRVRFNGEKLGQRLGGVFFICVGIGLVALGVYGFQNGARRPARILMWGIVAIISGFLMVIGRPIAHD